MFGMQMGKMGGVGQMTLAQRIAYMFANSEPGAWYDPSDFSTLFQDSAGTTPVTAVEQPVGRMLDKSGNGNHAFQATTTKRGVVSRRVNLLVASEDLLSSSWEIGNGGTKVSSTRFNFSGTPHSQIRQLAAFPIPIGATVRAQLKLSGNGTCNLVVTRASIGIYEDVVLPITLTPTEQVFDLSKTFANPQSGAVITISKGASGTATYVDVAYADIRLGIDAHLPYQWVNTATDYDTDPNKFPTYIRFDGVDDAYQTNSIDFTGTDKMTVWAGVTKLSDAAPSVLLELSVNSYLNLGTIGLFTPTTVNGNDISQRSIGTSDRVLTVGGFTSPMSFVVTGYMGITPPIIGLRIAGSVIGTTSASQGTGNYGNYPLYIGARAGTSLFLNGKIYSLIVRGAESSLSQIEATELYMKQKMRLP